jgi:threonine/homoserine/homoserine lactone efflux protein
MDTLAMISLARGWRLGLVAVAGVAAGLMVHAVVAALGVGELVARVPALYEVLRWAGVAFLLWLAVEGWRGEPEGREGAGWDARLFRTGFLANVFNPKSILFFVAVVPRFLVEGGGLSASGQLAILGAVYVGVATGVHVAIVLLAARLRPWLMAGPRRDAVRRAVGAAGGRRAVARLEHGALTALGTGRRLRAGGRGRPPGDTRFRRDAPDSEALGAVSAEAGKPCQRWKRSAVRGAVRRWPRAPLRAGSAGRRERRR